ncbi:MAG: hypothetical protein HOC71_03045, partial [Candidatus Latescibacteria bacterium]|nr:hypothetical protein [Candidatus Latescibacterota bacterium]
MQKQSPISITRKLSSVAILTLCIAILLVYSCDKEKEKSIVGPVEDTYTISGKVVKLPLNPSNIGFQDVTVYISGNQLADSTLTDSDGTFTFSKLSVDTYTLTMSKQPYIFRPQKKEVKISKNNIVVDEFYSILLDDDELKNYYITGKIVDDNCNIIDFIRVKLFEIKQNNSIESIGFTKTWQSGHFFYGLSFDIKNKTFILKPEKIGYEYTFNPDSCIVTVNDNIIIHNFIAKYSGSPLHTISGRIINIDTDLKSEFYCNVFLLDGKDSYLYYADSMGTYIFRGLKDGIYKIVPRNAFYTFSSDTLTVTVEGEDAFLPDITCEYTGSTYYTYSGRTIDTEGNAIPGVRITFLGQKGTFDTDEEGRFNTETAKYSYYVTRFDGTKSIFFVPSKSGYTFSPDTTWVTI